MERLKARTEAVLEEEEAVRERRTRRADIFGDRTRMEGERACWQIELDRVVIAARDFVWLRPVIQTHDFLPQRDVKVPFPMDSSHQEFPPIFTLYEISRIFKGTSYPADRKTCNPERNRSPPKMQTVIRPGGVGRPVCSGQGVRWTRFPFRW